MDADSRSTIEEAKAPAFYNMHVSKFCEGYAESLGVRSCTPTLESNLPEILEQQVDRLGHSNASVALVEEWPITVIGRFQTITELSHAMYKSYCAAIGTAAVGVFLSIPYLGREAHYGSSARAICNIASILALTTSSAIATHVAQTSVATLDRHGHEVGLSARGGTKFLALTWSSTILMVCGALFGCSGFLKTAFEGVQSIYPYTNSRDE